MASRWITRGFKIIGLDITPAIAQKYHLPVNQGVLVIATSPGGPAGQAGLKGVAENQNNPVGDGDIITAINRPLNIKTICHSPHYIRNQNVAAPWLPLSLLRHGRARSISRSHCRLTPIT